jgi:hypothetical protein
MEVAKGGIPRSVEVNVIVAHVSGKKKELFLRRLANSKRFPSHLIISIHDTYPARIPRRI